MAHPGSSACEPSSAKAVGKDGLYYARRGSGAPLLLIQGAAATHLHWGSRLMSLLALSFDAVAYDHRGVGYSAPALAPFTLRGMTDDAARVLDEVGWDRAAVFGVSLGGLIAQELALRYPDRVDTLVLGCTSPGSLDRQQALEDYVRKISASVVHGNPDATLRNFFRLSVKDATALRPEAWLEYRQAATSMPVHPRIVAGQVDASARHWTANRLPNLHIPTHVIHGESDRLVDLAEGALVAQAIPAARFTVLPAGHLFWLELPEVTAALVQDSCLARRAWGPG